MEKSKELSVAQKRKQRKILWEKRESENSKIRKITSLFDRVSTSATASNEANSKGQMDTGDNDIGLVVSEIEIEFQECTECSSGSIRQG